MRTLPALILSLLGIAANAAERPNIIWIVTEDISPNLACYGDRDAVTPNLDAFAKQGARFTRAFTHAPVCAPSRSGLITGQYPTTLGSHHMRSKLTGVPPMFTDELRKAGYRVFWPGKTDFNFDQPKGWVDSTADWTKQPKLLDADKPFFAFINIFVTHESQARPTEDLYRKNTAQLTPNQKHDPAKMTLPPYYPDTPDVRKNFAIYHDNISAMDHTVGDILKMLDEKKLSENTIVFFFGDHGMGLPRGSMALRQRTPGAAADPLAGEDPGRERAAEDLVCFLDFAPSLLAAAGAEVPKAMVGRAIFGDKTQPAPKYLFAARDRMDEAFDRIRSVRSERYHYIRNFHPELPYAQWLNYNDEMPIMKDWRRLAFEGKLNDAQKHSSPEPSRRKNSTTRNSIRTRSRTSLNPRSIRRC